MKRTLLLLGLAAVFLAVSGCGKKAPTAPPKAVDAARAVTFAVVEARPISTTATASGVLVAREEAAVGVEQAGYRVVKVEVEEGAQVEAGQILATLDDSLLRSRISQAQAQAEKAQGEAERVRGLEGTGVISDEEIASRRSQARIAAAQLGEFRTQEKQLTVRAPVAGIVLERTVRPGSVSGGEPMFRIARDGLIELDAEVPEAAVLGIRVGSKAVVTLADGQTLDGSVRLVSPRIDPATKLGRARIELPQHEALRVGGYARASFSQARAPVAVVPEKAVQFEASGPQVTVIDAQDRARRMAIKTGARADGYVELIDGPPLGSRVALGGGAFLLDGDLVQPMPAPQAETAVPPAPLDAPQP